MATIEQTAQLNKLLKEQNKLLEAQAKLMKSQALSVKAMVEAMKGMPLDEASDSFQKMNEAIKDAEEAVNKLGQANTTKLTASVKESTSFLGALINEVDRIPTVMTIAIGTAGGVLKGFRNSLTISTSVIKSAVSGLATLGNAIFNLGTSILSVPFKMFNALMDEAANISGTEFRQAIEDTRKQFGQLSTNEGKAVMDSFRSMRGDLAETGLSVRRVLGNFAERLRHLKEMAEAIGPAFSVLKETMAANAEAAVAYQKGLGLTEEGMKGVADRAIALGTTFQEQGRQITTMAYQMGESFGINGKLISRDVGTMMNDIENFGGLSIKTMTQVATYTRKLGLEMKDLQGIIGKFDDFEDAAKAAAQLNQAFGIQLDTIGLLKDQDPASRFDKMRRAFLATGRSVEQLTRQERNLLAQQTGLSDKAIQLGFANKNLGYEEIQKEAKKAEDNQLTQAQAMDKLAMSIERMVKSGEAHRGFWDTFIKGLARGIRWSRPFRRMLISLKRALNATFFAGISGGRRLVQQWDGLKEVFEGFTGFFKELGHFSKKGKSRGFFKDFADGMIKVTKGGQSINDFFDEMRDKLWNIFTGENAQKIVESFKKVFMALGKAAGEGIKFIIPKISAGIKLLADFIRNPDKAIKAAQGSTKGFANFFINAFAPAFNALRESWPQLKEALGELISVAWQKLKPKLKEAAINAFKVYSTSALWFAAWGAAKGAIISGIGKGAIQLFKSSGSTILKKVGAGKGGVVGALAQKVLGDPKEIKSIVSSGSQMNQVTDTLKSATEKSKGLDTGSFAKFGKTLAKAAIAFAAIGLAVTAMAAHAHVIVSLTSGIKPDEMDNALNVLKGMVLMYTGAALIIGESALVGALITSGVGALAAGVGFATLATTVTLMGVHAHAMIALVGSIDISKTEKAKSVIGAVASMYTDAALAIAEATAVGLTAMSGIGTVAILAGFTAIDEVIDSMLEKAGSIIIALQKLPSTAGLGKKVDAVSNILNTMTNLAQSVFQAMGSAGGSTFESIINVFRGGSVVGQMEKAMTIMTNMLRNLTSTAKEMITYVVQLAAQVPAGGEDKVMAIGNIIDTIANLSSALRPPSDNAFTDTLTTLIDPNHLSKVSAHMLSVLTTIKNNIPEMLNSFVEAANMLKASKIDNSQIEAVSNIFTTVGQLMEAFKPSPEMLSALDQGFWSSLGGLFKKMLPGSKDGGNITDKLYGPQGVMTKMIQSFTQEGGILDEVSGFATKIAGRIENADVVKSGVSAISKVVESVQGIVDVSKTTGKNGMLPDLSGLFSSISNNVLNPVLANVDGIVGDYEELSSRLEKKDMNVVNKVGKIIEGMIKEANSITNSISKADPIEINSRLKKVGEKIGDRQNFTIKRQDMVVNVNLNVTMDADEIKDILKKKGVQVREKSRQ